MRIVSGIVFAALSAAFAVAAAFLAWFAFGGATFLAYALVLVFVLGSVVAARSARDAFAGRARDRAGT